MGAFLVPSWSASRLEDGKTRCGAREHDDEAQEYDPEPCCCIKAKGIDEHHEESQHELQAERCQSRTIPPTNPGRREFPKQADDARPEYDEHEEQGKSQDDTGRSAHVMKKKVRHLPCRMGRHTSATSANDHGEEKHPIDNQDAAQQTEDRARTSKSSG